MQYRKFRANQLFDGYRFRNQNSVLITTAEGVVVDIVEADDAGNDVEVLTGILSPGLINCHCHLELSHLKNVIPPHTGLIDFLISVVSKRDTPAGNEVFETPEQKKQAAIVAAEKEMYEGGIVAVGDIGNTADTAMVKSNSNICWQNFVEVISFTDEKASENFNHYEQVAQELSMQVLTSSPVHRTSLVPHAPYSISPKTFQLINHATANKVISIHNQEHPAEDELYQTGGGDYLKLFNQFGMSASPFPVTGKSSIRSYLPYFNRQQTILLVHNTYMPEKDIVWANDYAATNSLQLVYCLCPNANLYIENKTPPVELLLKHNCTIVLGTDSYSSNWQLSIAKEMEALQQHTALQQEQLLQFATSNGAKALQWNNELGSFEKGKKPGIVLLKNDLSESIRVL
jgi:aminodeoxyfutalosine deaminase